ncbi:hypothetical protein HK096_010458 [Nowakowskiella sp. JEL0078]|nr:hypothetical protein HK096_010458 [Nowakowskiella sp. JEL0078]
MSNVVSSGSSNCSGYDFYGPANYAFKSGNVFFPSNVNGKYLLYSDGLVRETAPVQAIRSENNNELGRMCMPRPAMLQGKITNQFYVQGFLADGNCYPMKTDDTTISYWQATCTSSNTSSTNSTKVLKYSCSDSICTQGCQLLDVSDNCAGVCVNVSDYRNTPMFGWGSPLLNALAQLSTLTSSGSGTDIQNETATRSNVSNISSSSQSDSSIIVVAVSVGGSVILLAISVIIASLIFSSRRKQRKLDQGSSFNFTNSASRSSSMNSDSEISTKAVLKARRQYKNAVKEAKRQQNSTPKQSYTNSVQSFRNKDLRVDSESRQSNNSNSLQTPNELKSSNYSQNIGDEFMRSQISPKVSDLAMMEFPFQSESDLSSEKMNERTPTPSSIFESLERTHRKMESDTSSLFYQNAFIAATQAAHAASMAAAMAASAASNAANIIAIVGKRQHSKPLTEKKSMELDSLERSSSSSNVVVSSTEKIVPDFANPVFGTPESQYGILGNTSPNEFFLNANTPSLQTLLYSIPPIVIASETTSTTIKLPDGTETTTTVARSMNKIGGINESISSPTNTYTYPQIMEQSNKGKMIEKETKSDNVSGLQKTIAVFAHFAEESNEIDLIVGDIIKLVSVGPVWSVAGLVGNL